MAIGGQEVGRCRGSLLLAGVTLLALALPATAAANVAPTAAFTVTPAPPGSSTIFDGAASSDPDGGTITRFDWDFGDGITLPNGGPVPSHVYALPGVYTATLTVTDSEGCSVEPTATCDGGPSAQVQQVVDLAPPIVTLPGPPNQKAGRFITVPVLSDENGTAGGSARLGVKVKGLQERKFELTAEGVEVLAGQQTAVSFRLGRTPYAVALQALGADGKADARVTVTVTDAAGNVTSKKKRIRLKSGKKGHR